MYQGVVSKFVLPLSTFCFFRILPISPGKASFCSELFTIAKRKNPNQKSTSLYNRSLVEDNRHTDYIFRRQKAQKSFQNVRLWFKTSIFNNLPTNLKASWNRLSKKAQVEQTSLTWRWRNTQTFMPPKFLDHFTISIKESCILIKKSESWDMGKEHKEYS